MSTLKDLDWPDGKPFSFRDEPGDHDPCYVVMPDGAMLPVNHHAGPGVDIARAKFIISACNAALDDALPASKEAEASYQEIFNAIAAATKIEAGAISISVKDFRAALSTAIPAGDGVTTEDAVERASAAYAKATGYYVEFHRGLRSESSDKIRRGIRAALSTASTAEKG